MSSDNNNKVPSFSPSSSRMIGLSPPATSESSISTTNNYSSSTSSPALRTNHHPFSQSSQQSLTFAGLDAPSSLPPILNLSNSSDSSSPGQKLLKKGGSTASPQTSSPSSCPSPATKSNSDTFVTTFLNKRNQLIEISGDPLLGNAKRKRNRPTISCMNCKKKKIKCDRSKPICGSCAKNNVPEGSCVYFAALPSIFPNKQRYTAGSEGCMYDRQPDQNDTNRFAAFPDDQQQQQQQKQQQQQQQPSASSSPPPPPPPQQQLLQQQQQSYLQHQQPSQHFIQSQPHGSNQYQQQQFPQHPSNHRHRGIMPVPSEQHPVSQSQIHQLQLFHPQHQEPRHPLQQPSIPHSPPVYQQEQLQYHHKEFMPPLPKQDHSHGHIRHAQETHQSKEVKRLEQQLAQKKIEYEHEILRLRSQLQVFKSTQHHETHHTEARSEKSTNNKKEEYPILKGARLARKRHLAKFSRFYRVEKNSSSLLIGSTSWRSALALDPSLGPFMASFQSSLKTERLKWKEKFQMSTVYRHKACDHELDLSQDRTVALISMINNYLKDYDAITSQFNCFFDNYSGALPFLPKEIVFDCLERHVFKDESTGHAKLRLEGKKMDFVRIALVLMALKSSYVFNLDPSHFTDPSKMYLSDEDDMLYYFASKLMVEAKTHNKSTIPSLLTFILMYFISLKTLKKDDCGDFRSSSVHSNNAVTMAINLGFHREKSDAEINVRNKGSENNYFYELVDEETWRKIWLIVKYIDVDVAINSGKPALISENIYTTKRSQEEFAEPTVYLLRKTCQLMTSTEETCISLEKVEGLIKELENLEETTFGTVESIDIDLKNAPISTRVVPFMKLIFKFKACEMIMFLYNHTYDTLKAFIKSDLFVTLSDTEQKEFVELEAKYFKRSLNYSIIMLSILNFVIVNNYHRTSNFNWLSTDLRTVVLRVVVTLCKYIAESCKHEASTSPVAKSAFLKANVKLETSADKLSLLVDDLDLRSLELLMHADSMTAEDKGKYLNSLSSSDPDVRKFISTKERIQLPFRKPKTLLSYLNSFFYNTSRLSIALDYTFFATYKYLFLSLNYLKDAGKSIEEFDVTEFMKSVENVDNSWFAGNQ